MDQRYSLNIANTTRGIFYIIWIILAWTVVGFFKSMIYSKASTINATMNLTLSEIIRFFVFIGPIVFFVLANFQKPWYRWLGLYGCKKGTLLKTSVVTLLYVIIASAINIYGFHKKAQLSAISPTFWFTTFSLSIIMEEIAFRGFLFHLFQAWNKQVIVIVTALAFAAKHIPGWYFFPMEVSPLGFMGDFFMVFFVGVILGCLYLVTHSIWATSVLHGINNLIVAIFS